MPTITLYHELAQLADSAPEEFVALRRHLVERVLQPDGVPIMHLCELQQSIDQAMVLAAAPRKHLQQLHELLDERLAALAALTRRLEGEVGECA